MGVSQVACKYGKACSKRALGLCHFNHDIPTDNVQKISVEKPNARSKSEQ